MSTETKPAPSKAVAKYDYTRPPPNGVQGLQDMGRALLPQIAAALPGFMARHAERMLRCLLTECQRTPKLLDCSPKSLFGGVIQAAQLGLELGGPAGHAYLLPFGNKQAGVTEATLVIGYKGFIVLAFRAGVRSFTPRVVREGDTFAIEYGTRAELRHVPRFPADGAPLGYYAVVNTPTGGTDFEYLTRAEAEEHKRRHALAQNGSWASSFDEMAKKTCVRKLAKRVPLSVEWVRAAALDEMADEGVPQQLAAAVVIEGDAGEAGPSATSSLRERLDRAKKPLAAADPGASPDLNLELDEHGNPIFQQGAQATLFPTESGQQPKH